MGQGSLYQLAGIGTQPQGTTHIGIFIPDLGLAGAEIKPFFHQVDHRKGRFLVKLRGMGSIHTGNGAGKLDHGHMHTQADTEEGHLFFPGIGNGLNLPLHTAAAETTRHQDAVTLFELIRGFTGFQFIGGNILQLHLRIISNAAMHQGLMQTLIRLFQVHIFAGDTDGNRMLRVLDLVDQLFPGLDVGCSGPDTQFFQDTVVNSLFMQPQRHLVDGVHIYGSDHRFRFHIAEQSNFFLK